MKQTFSTKEKFTQFAAILFPILVTQFAMMSMNFFDTMMSGRVSAHDLAGVAIGANLWIPVFTGLSGILMAVTPIIAQLVGSNKKENVPFSVIQAIYAAIAMAVFVLVIGMVFLDSILMSMKLEHEVRTIAKQYLHALAIGIVPLFVYTVLRNFVDALGQTRVTMMITLLSLPINVSFNYVLIFGKFGFPALGGVGAGVATAITYWVIFLITLFIVIRQQPFSFYRLFGKLYAPSWENWKELLKIGVPIGFAIFFETSIFAAVTLLMSAYDTNTIASHQAAINFASFLYMIPLSISMALTIVVGFEAGAKRYEDARQYSRLGVWMAVMMAFICGIFLFYFREPIAGMYTTDKEVLALTSQFLLYAIFFQLSDALQAPIQGALRGYKDVNVTFIMALISYWIIGLPLGYILANYTSLEAFGYWIGLITGLAAGAIGLSYRLMSVQRRFKQLAEAIEKSAI